MAGKSGFVIESGELSDIYKYVLIVIGSDASKYNLVIYLYYFYVTV